MSAKKFLIASFSFLFFISCCYFLLVDNVIIIKRPFPYSYKQFLLESSAPIKGKLIIESGSNSIYGIDPIELSKYFTAPVLTIANNAGYPLEPKIFNIEKYTQAGDVLLLPLEWNQYSPPVQLKDGFLSSLADQELRLEFFFNNLPLWEKIKFVFTKYPLFDAFNGFKQRFNKIELSTYLNELSIFKLAINAGTNSSFGNSDENALQKPYANSLTRTCDQYTFYKGDVKSFIISSEFKNNLKLLKKLTKKGVSVYFIWPSVVSRQETQCYQHPKISRYVAEITDLVEQAGFQFIGHYQQSISPPSCFLGTYYHITKDCATARTKLLIKEFQALQIEPLKSNHSTTEFIKLVNKKIDKLTLNLIQELSNQSPVKKLGNIELSKQIAFIQGWKSLESWGIWSTGTESIFSFKIADHLIKKESIQLKIKGAYFDGSAYNQTAKTKVTINGQVLGSYTLTNKILNIPSQLITNKSLIIQLNYLPEVGVQATKISTFALTEVELLEVK